MFLSIIIPIYNSEKFIDKCIRSVISQTDKDIEVILIDDGSNDKGCNKAEEMLKENLISYNVIKKNHQGQSIARNIGIQNAKGSYVLFLDSDDVIKNDMVEVCKRKCGNSDITIFGYNRISATGEKKNVIDVINKNDVEGIDILMKYKNNEIPLWTSNIIYNRLLLKKYKIFYCNKGYAAEDISFIFKALLCSKKVNCISDVLSCYCERSDSLTNKGNIKDNISVIDSFEDVLMFIEEKQISYKIEGIIEKEFIPEHIMYQILTYTTEENADDIVDILYEPKVRKYLKMGKIFTPRYGRSMVKWMKIASRNPEKFVRKFLKVKG